MMTMEPMALASFCAPHTSRPDPGHALELKGGHGPPQRQNSLEQEPDQERTEDLKVHMALSPLLKLELEQLSVSEQWWPYQNQTGEL